MFSVFVCSCASAILLNVGLHPTCSLHVVPPSLMSHFLDQSSGDLPHNEDSPRLSFLFRKLSVSGQYFLLLFVLCQFHNVELFPKPSASY